MEYCFFVSLITVLVTGGLGQAADVYMVLGNEIISEHSLVNLYDIGNTKETGLRCVTERVDCCSGDNGTRAEWFNPAKKPGVGAFIRSRNGLGSAKGYVNLFLRNLNGGSDHANQGIYHCNIPAPSPSDEVSTLYVGIYKDSDEGIPTVTSITHDQLNSDMFTLTCISTGGPATNITWTLNGSVITYDANHVLTQTVINTITAEYNNTLTVTGREAGNYQCTVSNARGSNSMASQLLPLHFTEQPSSSYNYQPASSITPTPTTQSSITPTPITQSSITPNPTTQSSLIPTTAIVGSAMAAVLLVVTVILSIVIMLLVLRLRHGSGAVPVKERVAFGPHSVIQINPIYPRIHLSDSRAATKDSDHIYSHLDHKSTTVKHDPTYSHIHHRLTAEKQTSALNNEYASLDCKTTTQKPAPVSAGYSHLKLDHEALTEKQDPTSSRGKGKGRERGGDGAFYSEPAYEVISEQPVMGKTVLSSTTEETVYEQLD